MNDFLAAFSKREIAGFMPYFAAGATVFFPPAVTGPAKRVQGRSAIEQTFKSIFSTNKQSPATNRPPIAPQDLLIQELDYAAVVTFHLGNDAARHRRTFVLQRVADDWKIVHLHASAIEQRP